MLDLPDWARQDPAFLTGGQLGRDGCRVPLPWTAYADGAHGFSPPGAPDPWLPQPDELGQLRARPASGRTPPRRTRVHTAQRFAPGASCSTPTPACASSTTSAPGVLAFTRSDVLVLTNTTSRPIDVPTDLAAGRAVALCSSPEPTEPATVPADATVWLKLV